MDRKGEKIGWTYGWIGGFIWILVLGILMIIQGKTIYGAISIVVFFIALFLIVKFSPWKYPNTKYWKLMIPIYSMFFISVIFVISVLTGFDDLAEIQYGFWIIPCFVPIFVMRNRTWN